MRTYVLTTLASISGIILYACSNPIYSTPSTSTSNSPKTETSVSYTKDGLSGFLKSAAGIGNSICSQPSPNPLTKSQKVTSKAICSQSP